MTRTSHKQLLGLIGQEKLSTWLTVDQAMITGFAAVTGDDQFIHVDAERAAQTPFGGTIAHGYLMLSLLPQLLTSTANDEIGGVRMALNYGIDRVRFIAPVRSGSRVRARFSTAEVVEKAPGQYLKSDDVTIEIEGIDKPAMIARTLALLMIGPSATNAGAGMDA
jgi:acyl dehydratase